MSAPDPNIKQLVVTGNAAETFMNKGTRKKRSRRSENTVTATRKSQEGGTSPGTIVQLQATRAPGPNPVSEPVANVKPSTTETLAKVSTNSTPAETSQEGGANL